jgi:hypothetical protein
LGKEEEKVKDKKTNKAYNPDKMFENAINSKWFKRIAKRIKNNITRLQSPYLIP